MQGPFSLSGRVFSGEDLQTWGGVLGVEVTWIGVVLWAGLSGWG